MAKRFTDEQREQFRKEKAEKLDALKAQLVEDVKNVYTSDAYLDYLAVCSKFHHYSFNNALLIALQCPHAQRVAGFTTWKRLGRYVMKGEKGIQILCPRPYKYTYEEEEVKDKNGNVTKELRTAKQMSFDVGYVYDVSQTDGKELPTICVELDGSVEQRDAILSALTKVTGISFRFEDIQGGSKGYYSPIKNEIVIKEGMSDLQTIKTAIHESAHSLFDNPCSHFYIPESQRRDKEIRAESTAFIVSASLNLDTSDYSFEYVASWAQGKEYSEIAKQLEDCTKAAHLLIASVELDLGLNIETELAEGEGRSKTIYIDTETTGLDTFNDEILQVSIIDGHGNVLLDSYVNPTNHTEWEAAQAINGITPEMVADAPTIQDLKGKILDILSDVKYIVGQNVSFDAEFLANALGKNISNGKELKDTMRDFAQRFGERNEEKKRYNYTSLSGEMEHFGLEWNGTAHNSLADVYATKSVWEAMHQRFYLDGHETAPPNREGSIKIPFENIMHDGIVPLLEKPRAVAIESTEDYYDTTFHSDLVNADIRNTDGSYGQTKDYYRIVTIDEVTGRLTPYDNRTFVNSDSAKEAVAQNSQLQLIDYDSLVHTSYEKITELKKTTQKTIENNKPKNTVVVNAFGGAGAGKTTAALSVAAELKKRGYITEYVPEYAKELILSNNFSALDGSLENQRKVYEEQRNRIERCLGKVDFIVTDCPIIISGMFLNDCPEKTDFQNEILEQFNKNTNFSFVIQRDENKFEQENRMGTFEEAKAMDSDIQQYLADNNIPFDCYDHTHLHTIVENSIKMLNGLENANSTNDANAVKDEYIVYEKETIPEVTLVKNNNIIAKAQNKYMEYDADSGDTPVLTDEASALYDKIPSNALVWTAYNDGSGSLSINNNCVAEYDLLTGEVRVQKDMSQPLADVDWDYIGKPLKFENAKKFVYSELGIKTKESLVDTYDKNKKRLFVDMDGTLFRFNDEVNYLERMFEKGFFENLKPFETAISKLKDFMKHHPEVEVFILSATVDGEPPHCRNEKNILIDKYLPEIDKEHRIFTKVGENKSSFIPHGISQNDFLYDDYNKNLEEWQEAGGTSIKCKNNINHKGLVGKLWEGKILSNESASFATDLFDIIGEGEEKSVYGVITNDGSFVMCDNLSDAYSTFKNLECGNDDYVSLFSKSEKTKKGCILLQYHGDSQKYVLQDKNVNLDRCSSARKKSVLDSLDYLRTQLVQEGKLPDETAKKENKPKRNTLGL